MEAEEGSSRDGGGKETDAREMQELAIVGVDLGA